MESMSEGFDIQAYMTKGVERVVSEVMRATLKNPKESAYMVRFATATKKASKKRAESEKQGEHVPPFLIASITSSCNLHCVGCYSRCVEATTDEEPENQLMEDEWGRIFDEANELGVSFILLAGGEPLLRRDVIEEAGNRQDILFPIFTNGTYIDESYFTLFDKRRNLIPILSIEGGREETTERRGEGVYEQLMSNMNKLSDGGLIFGVSITVTTRNISEVTSDEFIKTLVDIGCKAVIYVEYVPVTDDSVELAPLDDDRELLKNNITRLRDEYLEVLFVSFPGDEKSSGGCIAAGRGFFHINSHGGAEPCPFSPYSDVNVKDTSLKEAMNSRLFYALRDGGLLSDTHAGGCVLFEKQELVKSYVAPSY